MKNEDLLILGAAGAAAFGLWYYFGRGKETLAGAPGEGGAIGRPLFYALHPGAVEAPNLMGGGAGAILPAPASEKLKYFIEDIAGKVSQLPSQFVQTVNPLPAGASYTPTGKIILPAGSLPTAFNLSAAQNIAQALTVALHPQPAGTTWTPTPVAKGGGTISPAPASEKAKYAAETAAGKTVLKLAPLATPNIVAAIVQKNLGTPFAKSGIPILR